MSTDRFLHNDQPEQGRSDEIGPLMNDTLCICGEPDRVAPDGFTARHRSDGPCYVRPHDARFDAVWQAIKGWDLRRHPGVGYAGATGDDVCSILEALEALEALPDV